jgi:hypothetical protein
VPPEQPPAGCDPVDMYTVDTYIKKIVEPKVMSAAATVTAAPESSNIMIDFLSVDTEGEDWVVLGLGGANTTLSRTKYLEFEYHSYGSWPKYNLLDVTIDLWEQYGMICFYVGIGKLWRLTHCFQDYLNVHEDLGNVACVNPDLEPLLAERMEAMFQSQLVVG